MARRRSTSKTTPRTWFIRAGVGVAIGIFVGFGIGATAVHYLQPPGVVTPEPDVPDTTNKSRAGSDGSDESPVVEDDRPQTGIVVPELIGMEEGDARAAIVHAGFTVGSVTFRGDAERMGTVVASFPVPGEAVRLPGTINLILSDGKGRPDSTANPSQR
ncbi:MAG: PASTA domain-containing protein [Gemmatimonadaceae bacterium]